MLHCTNASNSTVNKRIKVEGTIPPTADYACESMRAKYSDTKFASVSSDFDLNKRIGANDIVNKDATNREVAVG